MYKTYFTTADFHFVEDGIEAVGYFSINKVRRNILSDIPEIRFIPLREVYIQILDKIENAFEVL